MAVANTPCRMRPIVALIVSCMLVSACADAENTPNIKNSTGYEKSLRSQNISQENRIHTSVPEELASSSLFQFDGREILDSEISENKRARRKLNLIQSSQYLRRMDSMNSKALIKIDFGTSVSKVSIQTR